MFNNKIYWIKYYTYRISFYTTRQYKGSMSSERIVTVLWKPAELQVCCLFLFQTILQKLNSEKNAFKYII